MTANGSKDVIQGITVLTPEWAKVEGLKYVWDMRIATSTIPRDTLHKILLKNINPKSAEDFKKIAGFYLQGERYEEARAVLEGIQAAFPNQADLKEPLRAIARALGPADAQRAEAAARRRPAPHGSGDAGKVPHRRRWRRDTPGHQRDDRRVRYPPVPPAGPRQELEGLREKVSDTISRRTSSPSSMRLPRTSAPIRWTAWRPTCKMPTTPKPPIRRRWPWPSAGG